MEKIFSHEDPLCKAFLLLVKEMELPVYALNDEKLLNASDRLEYLAYSQNVRTVTVDLYEGWHKQNMGPFLGYLNGEPCLCCRKIGGYVMIDPDSGAKTKITQQIADEMDKEAIVVCPSVPREGLSVFSLVWKSLISEKKDLLLYLLITILSTASVVAIPYATSLLVTKVYPTRMLSSIMIITVMILCIALSSAMFMMVVDRLQIRIQESWQSRVVLQSSATISGTIKKNIALTNSPDTEKMEKAAKQAAIYDDICRMPDGFDTVINSEGATLSGGQKQRLMIARALMYEPKVLFFDEATSALDNTTQKKVQEALNSIPVTRITVAHRLSTIMECDRILVMDKGRIVEQGNYDELMEEDGLFARFAKRNML
jgi:ABC-type bacteriocin/lantibiotic exporter with double-glycine peptidase domain